jgi:hypothetical protein
MIEDQHQPYDKSSKWLIQHHGDSMLRPKGKYRIPRSQNLRSRHGLSSCRLNWRVVELWTIPAEDLLLAVTQVLTYLRYNDIALLTILGGRRIMLESPLIDELVMEKYGELLTEKTREAAREAACETAHQYIATVLEARFGGVPRDLAEEIELVVDGNQLKGLVRTAVACPDLDAFRNAIVRS